MKQFRPRTAPFGEYLSNRVRVARRRRRGRHRLLICVSVVSSAAWFCAQLGSINFVDPMTEYVMGLADVTGRKTSLLRRTQDMFQRKRIQHFHQLNLERQERQQKSALKQTLQTANSFTGKNFTGWRTKPPKFIKFDPVPSQGVGNLMHGLLAAHLLGLEFGRIVCVRQSDMGDFLRAFEPVHPMAVKYCPYLWSELESPSTTSLSFYSATIVNFQGAPNECHLKVALALDTYDVISLECNTYPRWSQVPANFFFQFYRPTQELLDMLPYEHNNNKQSTKFPHPVVVVHLRQGDNVMDLRKGLDEASLKALGENLPSGATTYLVTNRVEFFLFFEKNFGWSHPNWQKVEHSILKGSVTGWGQPLAKGYFTNPKNYTETELSMMQVYADWYTILTAKIVYHTFSDFSLSAVHWMNTVSRTYDGISSNGELLMLKENWIIDGESPRLVDRTGDELKRCFQEEQPGMGSETRK